MSYHALLATTAAQQGNVAAFDPQGLSPKTLGDGSYAKFTDTPTEHGIDYDFDEVVERAAAGALVISALVMVVMFILHGAGVFDANSTAAPKPEIKDDGYVNAHYSLYQERTAPRVPPLPQANGYSQSASAPEGSEPVTLREWAEDPNARVFIERMLQHLAPLSAPSIWDAPNAPASEPEAVSPR